MEGKNGAFVRKHLGYGISPKKCAGVLFDLVVDPPALWEGRRRGLGYCSRHRSTPRHQ